MKTKILDFLKRTQKATGALVGALAVLSSATFLPAPYSTYASVASVIVTWVVTYFLPYVEQAVQGFPDDQLVDQLDDAPVTDEVPVTRVAPVTGEIVEPPTVEYAAITPDMLDPTAGIPVVEGDVAEGFIPEGRLSVDDILSRLDAEEGSSVPA